MGDFGTLFPLSIGYIVVCGLNPAGFLVMMGVANIVTSLVYRLPMPIEPMKVLAVVAIAQQWSPSMVYASGFAMGVIWLISAGTGIIGWIARITPNSVIRGIQVTLGVMLAIQAFKMISTWWVMGIVSIGIILLLRQNRYAPAAILLMVLGMVIMFIKGQLRQIDPPALTLPPLTGFNLEEVWQTLLLAGFAQVPLTITNATIVTSSLIKTYWPDRSVSERRLSFNQGVMNLILPFFGGMPMCHGACGLAGQYYFGARMGGTNIYRRIYRDLHGIVPRRFNSSIVFSLSHGNNRCNDVYGRDRAYQIRHRYSVKKGSDSYGRNCSPFSCYQYGLWFPGRACSISSNQIRLQKERLLQL